MLFEFTDWDAGIWICDGLQKKNVKNLYLSRRHLIPALWQPIIQWNEITPRIWTFYTEWQGRTRYNIPAFIRLCKFILQPKRIQTDFCFPLELSQQMQGPELCNKCGHQHNGFLILWSWPPFPNPQASSIQERNCSRVTTQVWHQASASTYLIFQSA